MKQIFYYLLFALPIFISCKPHAYVTKSELLGTWKNQENTAVQDVFKIIDDSTCIWYTPSSSKTYTYRYNDKKNRLILHDHGTSAFQFDIRKGKQGGLGFCIFETTNEDADGSPRIVRSIFVKE